MLINLLTVPFKKCSTQPKKKKKKFAVSLVKPTIPYHHYD